MANKVLNVCQSKLKESKSTFVWKIHNFSDRRQNANESLESGIFNSTSPSGELVMWSLHINYPNTNSGEFNISVNLVDTAASEVSAKIKFMIRNSLEKLIIRNRIFDKGQQYEPPKHLIDRNELYNAGNGFLPDDRLTIVFEVTIFEPMMAMEYGIVDEFDFPEFSAIEDMGYLFEQRLFTDCILVTEDGIKFEVHKGIVSCRSPVFRAMFAHEMIEAKEGIVRIKDVKSPVLEQMLKFMYSGKAPKLGEMALELFEASDKYEFDQLKISCEKELATSIGNENVCELLVLANQHSAQYLKIYAIKYIQKNAKEVMKSDGWKMLVEGNYGELFDLILKAIYD